MVEVTINYWALIVAALANMIVGMLWYGPLFGKKWMQLVGITADGMKSMAMKPWQAMIGGLINSLIIAYVLLFFTVTWVTPDIGGALFGAFWIWLGFVATTQIGSFLWEGKPITLFLINTSYSLVAYGVMSAILVLWR